MITQEDIWCVIDDIARKHGISASRLAIISGLDATVFNKSKRINGHYPSFRTIVSILNNTNISMCDFGQMCDRQCYMREQSAQSAI